eukprot:11187530-Alexandrium_andersonii.AAC.1
MVVAAPEPSLPRNSANFPRETRSGHLRAAMGNVAIGALREGAGPQVFRQAAESEDHARARSFWPIRMVG